MIRLKLKSFHDYLLFCVFMSQRWIVPPMVPTASMIPLWSYTLPTRNNPDMFLLKF